MPLSDFTSYADAQRHFSKQALWELFDGDRERLNIGHECVDRHAPERIAVRVAHGNGNVETLSFGELRAGSNQFANWLVSQGVQKGDRVAVMLEPSPAFYLALFGTMKMGAVAVPLFTLFGPDGLRLRLNDCTPKILLTTPDLAPSSDHAPHVAVHIADTAFLEQIKAQPAAFTPNTSADDMAMYQYTSGTTRELPEAVKHRHRAIVTVMIAALYATGVRPGDRYMCPSSPAWGHGLWHGTLAPMAMGVEIASYAGKFDPQRLFDAICEMEITNLSAAATHYRMMKNAGCGPAHGSSIEKLSFTGEPIDSDTETWVKSTFGVPVCSMYGTTEVGVMLASYPGASDFDVRPGSLGKPVPGIQLDILDPDGNACPPNVVGEIMLKRRDGWFAIKDLGHRDADGYWWHDGRADDVIISAGWTMSAKEIEDTLLAHPDVEEAAAIAVADDERGQVAKAFIVTTRSGDRDFEIELQEFTKERLARHEYPRRIEFADSLPKTPAGKVNRKILRDREAERNEAST
ncbi:MAG: acetate--CoA ligase [Rhodospirillaceae bacterium]|nr:acetate--CoA ligase [Rhodospirillaceae bacterium]|tara:strand:+ start:3021 stop:4574 length:1554 start_codon:yes stop_codon:yes gene_type:complete